MPLPLRRRRKGVWGNPMAICEMSSALTLGLAAAERHGEATSH
ncbi:hypothetical protein [Kitasatospora purpeofusca]|nr:hypothetical protein OIP63_21720 [Kitasatospora purpeofusca]